MADLGSDVDCVADISPTFALVRGRVALAQAIARRLGTPRGGLFYAPGYGYDLRAHLNADIDDTFRISAAVEAECLKDERVRQARAAVTFEPSAERLSVRLELEDAEGPFDLVLGVSYVTVEILSLSSS